MQGLLTNSLLRFWQEICWQIDPVGLERLPKQGPVFIPANCAGNISLSALMLGYALMRNKENSRHINVLVDFPKCVDKKLYQILEPIKFIPWSYESAKMLFEAGELVITFPENIQNNGQKYMFNRLQRFDWTKFIPAIESNIPIYPLLTLTKGEGRLCRILLLSAMRYNMENDRELLQEEAKKIALCAEGEIQAEINRLLRTRTNKQH